MRSAVEHVMGTVFSLAVPPDTDDAAFRAAAGVAFAFLRHVDVVFSRHRPDSAASRITDGRLRPDALGSHPHGAEIREVLDLCARLERASDGAFDAWRVGDPPGFDPSGAVKGWAADRASDLLVRHGCGSHILNAGGDVRLRGGVPSAPWGVGIADPHRAAAVLSVLHLHEGAVATSGVAERGGHVFEPRSGRPASVWDQVTVTGGDLASADGFATAALAMAAGPRGAEGTRDWLRGLATVHGHQALTVDRRGGLWMTDGMRELLCPPAVAAPTVREG